MLIISAGMQKSGSAYLYNLINGLLKMAGNPDAAEIRAKRGLDDILRSANHNVKDLSFLTLFRLLRASSKEGSFAIKTHRPPTLAVRALQQFNLAQVIYIYRDPRDALLSVMDHGRKALATGEKHPFTEMIEFDVAFEGIKRWLETWREYQKLPNLLQFRYEDLLADPLSIVKKCAAFLKVEATEQACKDLIWQFNRDNPNVDRETLHLNKGVACRYKDEMTSEQRSRCRTDFGGVIEAMGYALD